jgi:hypothetical protein
MKIFSNFRSENDPLYNILREKFNNKPITFFYDYIPKNIDELNINPYNFIMIHEPNEFFGMHTWVMNNYQLFTGILTWNQEILDTCENAILFHHSCNNLTLEYTNIFKNKEKEFEISFLSGAKSLVEGHKLRQSVYKIGEQIIIPKKWFYVLEDFNWDDFNKGGIGRPAEEETYVGNKKICFNDSMFHVAIENVKHNNWYTEKIADAFNTKTVPLYWGCPNISEFGYDERGIIRFDTPKELLNIINNLTLEVYNNMKPYIDHNYNVANNEYHISNKLQHFFQELININNL